MWVNLFLNTTLRGSYHSINLQQLIISLTLSLYSEFTQEKEFTMFFESFLSILATNLDDQVINYVVKKFKFNLIYAICLLFSYHPGKQGLSFTYHFCPICLWTFLSSLHISLEMMINQNKKKFSCETWFPGRETRGILAVDSRSSGLLKLILYSFNIIKFEP